MSTTDAMTSAEREDRVLERIDKFRQRYGAKGAAAAPPKSA